MSYFFRTSLPVLLCITCLFVGCGGGEPEKPEVYAVSGTVTGGEGSLEGVLISFTPVDGIGGATGTLAADGSYELQSLDGRAGCEPGQYKIVLAMGMEAVQQAMQSAGASGGGPPEMQTPFPQEYSSLETSPKQVEVKAESNTIDIQL